MLCFEDPYIWQLTWSFLVEAIGPLALLYKDCIIISWRKMYHLWPSNDWLKYFKRNRCVISYTLTKGISWVIVICLYTYVKVLCVFVVAISCDVLRLPTVRLYYLLLTAYELLGQVQRHESVMIDFCQNLSAMLSNAFLFIHCTCQLYSQPQTSKTWSVMILCFSWKEALKRHITK